MDGVIKRFRRIVGDERDAADEQGSMGWVVMKWVAHLFEG